MADNPSRKRSRAEERALTQSVTNLEDQMRDMEKFLRARRVLPPDWYALHHKTPTVPSKVRLTLRVDRDMLEWYRGLGRGWQSRMNAVLRAYMDAVIAREIEQAGDRDLADRPL